MDKNFISNILLSVQKGTMSVEAALEKMRCLSYEDMGFAKIDHHRSLRRGFPEVIFCPGKTITQIVQIAKQMIKTTSPVLATRAGEEIGAALTDTFPQSEYNETARTVIINRDISLTQTGLVLVLSAGTADMPVAEEAAITAELSGSRVERVYDVGVAGIHRLLDNYAKLQSANVLVVAAGMEGALPSVVSGLVSRPVIAVPTSVGYGASFGGVAALLAMLNSCSPGISVVNIDNGFGAGYTASLINRHAASPLPDRKEGSN